MSDTLEAYSTKRVALSAETRDGKEGCRVEYQDGYVSWAPIEVIRRDYHAVCDGTMSFGQAVESLRLGNKVRRMGWRRKYLPEKTAFVQLIAGEAFVVRPGIANGETTAVRAYMATSEEMLACDWEEFA